MARHQTTIIDLARELGLSKSTVSRALTNHVNVHPDTRRKVLEAAQRTEYQPNLLAQSLVRHQTLTVGVVIPDIEKPFYASIVSGIQHLASRTGYRVIVAQSNESPDTEVANVQALVSSQVDGLLICHTRETRHFDHVRLLHRRGMPLVSFARIGPDLPMPKVVEDDRAGGRAMTEHLLATGRTRVAVLAGPEDLLASQLRVDGFLEAMQTHGLPVPEGYVRHTRFVKTDVAEALDAWLALPQPPEAVFSVYDAGAIQLIKFLKARGLCVPDDLAVAGFGDDPAADLIEPGLTTWHQSPYEIGRQAFQFFLDQLVEEPTPDRLHIVPGQLVVRESTGGRKR